LVVRVKVRLVRPEVSRSFELVLLVNSGAESEVPVVAVRPEHAAGLGLWPCSDYEEVEVA